jgi:RarD protein
VVKRGTMKSRENDRRSTWMFISSMLIFGTIGIFRRYIPLPSAFLAFSRGILGGLFLMAFLKLKRRKPEERLPVRTALWLAVSGAVMGVNWILLFEAYNYTTVAVATLCYYMQPTIVVLLSPVLFKERLTLRKGACAAVAVIGMVLVSGVIGGGPQAGDPRGVLFGLGAAVCYAVVVIMNKKITGVEAFQKTKVQLMSAGIVMIPYLLLTGGFSVDGVSALTVILLLAVGIVHTGVAYVLYFGSLEGLKAQSAAIFSYIDPVAALFFSALFLREPLSLPGIAGAVMIIGSAVVSEIRITE